jgi:hypothetical protein
MTEAAVGVVSEELRHLSEELELEIEKEKKLELEIEKEKNLQASLKNITAMNE